MDNLRGKNLCDPGKFMRHRRLPTNSVTHSGIMALKPNVVWVGCPDKDCKKMVAIKKCDKHEYTVQKKMNRMFPKIVPDVYEGISCFDGYYMYYEYVEEGTLKTHKSDPRILKFVRDVLIDLKNIHDKRPSFRHNDLHVDNVLIKKGTPLIYDFGFANWNGNPIFDSALKRDYGIYVGNHPMYDFHFFINSVSADMPADFKKRALSVFPKEYICESSSVVRHWRLRSDVKHPNLPTMSQVIQAFSMGNNKTMKRGIIVLGGGSTSKTVNSPPIARKKITTLTFANKVTKKTNVTRPVPVKTTRKFSLANKRKVSNRKSELIRGGMNNVQAELQAIRNIEKIVVVPSPRKSPAKFMTMLRKKVVVSNSPALVVTYTNTPQRRARIGKKLCSSYKKDELMREMKKLGHRVDKTMTIKEMCKKFSAPHTVKYVRPIGNITVNVRKVTYPKYLKKNLYSLAKTVGVPVLSKNRKPDIIAKLYTKLNKNINNVLSKANKNTITARYVAEKLAKNYNWKNDRHVERLRLLKIYANKK